MGTADVAVGMMDAAYFVGRKELLEFINTLLDLNLQKIEQTASGAVACQIFDMMFPGSIAMSRVNWEAKSDFEFVQNYKILQIGFNKHHVQRHVDVDKLIRAKYQDNLEFMQWFKAFFDNSGSLPDDYDPAAVREKGKGGRKYNQQFGNSRGGGGASRSTTTRPSAPLRGSVVVKATKKATTVAPAPARPSRPLRERPAANKEASVVLDAELKKKNADLTTKVEELELAVLEIEKERDFYFEKLRNVEVMLQVYQEKPNDPDHLIDKIFKVLYATAEDTLVVDDQGELIDASELEELANDTV